jgi:hypothetical protein
MPELTWTTWLAWFGVLTGAASVAGLIVAVVGNRTIKTMHAETQGTLKTMHAETQGTLKTVHAETQGTLKTMHTSTKDILTSMDTSTKDTLRALGEGQKGLGAILDRMDRQAEARYRDLKDHLSDGEEEVPPA